MKKYISFIFLFIVNIAISQTKNVLFLGNSYTYSNNMPQIVVDIANSVGDTIIFDANTPGGYTLQGHSTNAITLEKISQGKWDFVILQEQSQRPALRINQVIQDVFPYAKKLDSLINHYNTCCETMFFMTWGRKNGDSYYCPEWPPVCTYQGMDSLLHQRYMMMADSNNAVVSPVGAVWRYIRNNFPEIELYSADESHPSPFGSYAAACCFYTAIYRDDPTQITYNFNLDETIANQIKSAVKLVVFDSLMEWHIGEYDLLADFEFENLGGKTFQFTNLSNNTDSYLWNFGETTDTTTNPIYTFENSGTHTVVLGAFNSCDSMFTEKEIIVESIPEINSELEGIFISQLQGKILINNSLNKMLDIEIFNVSGKKIINFDGISNQIVSTKTLANGVYIINVKTSNSYKRLKIVVH